MNFQVVDPTGYPDWDNLIISHPDCSFFHSSAWAKVLRDAYHYTPLYFTVFEKRKLLALMPVMEISNVLTGKRGVSLPFTDYCNPIFNEYIQFENLFNHIIEYGRKRSWKYLELRSRNDLLPLMTPSTTYLLHTIDLSGGENKTFSGFRSNTKRNIKKAINEGLKAEILWTFDSVKEFYKLNIITRKRHGLPPQPFYFFRKVYEDIISRKFGFVVLVSYKNRIISGAVYFHLGKKALFKYGASDENFHHLRPNNLIMWEAIKWYSLGGYESLCLGRTEPENQGLIKFKSGWGATEKSVGYYWYNFRNKTFASNHLKVTGFHNKIFKRMPPSLLKIAGSFFYKYAG